MAAPIGLPLQPPQPVLGILILVTCHCEGVRAHFARPKQSPIELEIASSLRFSQ